MRALQQHQSALITSRLRIVAINIDEKRDVATVRSFVTTERLSFPVLLGTEDVAGVYNIINRHLFDRRRNLAIPTSFLVDESGRIVKVYQGAVSPQRLIDDVNSAPSTSAERIAKALPFAGTLYQGRFQRNDFSFGVALFQHGYLEQAAASFKQVIATKPNNPEAYYNLGTLYLRQSAFQDAQRNLEQAVALRPNYPEAWNNLGMLVAQQGHPDEAIRNFRQSLLLRPDYVTALVNLGNLYRHQATFGEAEKLLSHALGVEPDNPEVNYSLAMLYGQREQSERALKYLEKAVNLRPDYAEALNNLGVLLVQERRYPEAEERFKTCIAVAPTFDQAYLNLARLYAMLNDNEKAKEVLFALLQQQPQHKLAQQALEMLH
jgi:Flp pilus assembly protein TadD